MALVIAVLGANIRPDSAKDANTQHPELAILEPRSSVQFISLDEAQTQGFFSRLFFGGDAVRQEIPVDTFWVQGQEVFYYLQTSRGAEERVSRLNTEGKELQVYTRTFWLGTDKLGRCNLSRLMAGTIVSLSVGVISVGIALLIGIFLGGMAGFFGGWIDQSIMWFVNVVWSIPTLLMVMAITLALGKGFAQVFIAVGLTMWVEVARVTRGRFMELRQLDFVKAAELLNAPTQHIFIKEMLPNAVGPLVVIAAGNFSTAILLEAGLSFLGIGAQVPMASWGGMIQSHFSYLTSSAAFIPLIPGFAIMLVVLAFIWLGNTLRDAFDVRS